MTKLLRFASVAVAVLCICALPVLLRVLLVLEKQAGWGAGDVRGVLADVAIGLGMLALIGLAWRFSRVAAAVLTVLWTAINFINFEHIRILDAAVSATYAGYLTDSVFLEGSAMHISRPFLTWGVLAVLLLLTPFWPKFRRPGKWVLRAGAVVLVALVVAQVAWRIKRDQLPWRQDNFLVINVREAVTRVAPDRPVIVHDAKTIRELFRPDLSGTPRIKLPAGKQNVIVVLVEGFSGAYLPSFAAAQRLPSDVHAPKVDALGQSALAFSTVIAHNRQTNRGEYSVICGDYPKLVSEEARMTEIARGNERVCLPRILRDNGYQTAYLQAAPLGFMLKDQFMARAGFDRSYGTDYFTRAYARNRWGVDDKAFFEQALTLVHDLRNGGKPFFLGMLTVGTHHPYLVPEGFKASGSAYARAVAYADEAVAAFVEALKKDGTLDDTLVIITGDESAGVTTGDDMTRQISQSWIPVVALAPKVAPARVKEVFLQSDLALSILDYVGLAEQAPHFVGRSLFRTYENKRPIYFANTHSKRAWALEPSGILSTCTEELEDCASFMADYERPFDPRMPRLTFRKELLVAWRTVVDYTARKPDDAQKTAPRTVPLLAQDEVAIDADGTNQLLFGGQYLTVPKGGSVSVDLDVEAEGPEGGAIAVQQLTYSSAGKHYSPPLPLLRPGDRLRIKYDFVFDRDIRILEVVMYARAAGGQPMKLRFAKKQLTIDPAPSTLSPGLHTSAQEVTRQPLAKAEHYSLALPGFFQRGKCVNANNEAKACKAGILVFGPYAWAPQGAKVKARFEVEVTRGEALLRGEVVNNAGTTKLASSEEVRLTAGKRAVIESDFAAGAPLDLIEARLQSRPVGDPPDLVIRSATLDVAL